MSISSWESDVRTHHAQAVERGEHDDLCEWHPGGFYLCHCSKRRRVAAGKTTPPVMFYSSPICDGCGDEAEHNGDGWECRKCRVYFGDQFEVPGEWQDDYGPDLAGDLAKWEAARGATR